MPLTAPLYSYMHMYMQKTAKLHSAGNRQVCSFLLLSQQIMLQLMQSVDSKFVDNHEINKYVKFKKSPCRFYPRLTQLLRNTVLKNISTRKSMQHTNYNDCVLTPCHLNI